MMKSPIQLLALPAVICGCLGPHFREDPEAQKSAPNPSAPVSCGNSAPAGAGGSSPETATTLTLSQAMDLADRSHPEIAEALAQLDAAGGRAEQTGAFPNPVAVGRMESAPFEGRTTGEAEYVAGVSQRFPLGKRLSAASRVGRLEEERYRAELETRRFEVHRRVHGAFVTALYLDEVVKVEARAIQIAENGVQAANAHLAAGDALPEDVARSEMELERARLELERAQSLQQQAQAELRTAIGDLSLADVTLEGALETAFELPTLESLSQRLSAHPAVTAVEADMSVQRAEVELAQVQRIPDMNLDLLYRRLEISHTNAFDVGIAIPLPLFDRNQGNLREARAGVAAADARLRSTRNELERDLRQAHTRLASALADARVLRETILPRAELVLRAFEARYAAGDASLTELLPIRREQTTLALARLESLRIVMEAWVALSPYLPRG